MLRILHKLKRVLRPSYILLFIIQILITAPFILFGGFAKHSNLPQVHNGMIDLTTWDADAGGLLKLEGSWEFYWEQHLDYDDFHSPTPPLPDLLITVPDIWNGSRINENSISGSGFATYRLRIHVSETDRTLALKMLPIFTSYRIYADDQLLAVGGQAGVDQHGTHAGGPPQTVEFVAPQRIFDLIVHVSNFDHAKGGMNHSPILGSPSDLLVLNQKLVYKDMFLLGCLVIACFYSICMFLINREEKISLYFALVCLTFICRISLSGGYLLYEVIPGATLHLSEWINYTTFHGGILVYALLIRGFFPALFSERATRILTVATGIILVLIVILPMSVYSRLYLVSDVIGLVTLVYPYVVLFRAAVARMPYSWLIFFGNGLLLALGAADVINYEMYKREIGTFSNYWFFIFIFVYAFILARRFAISFLEAKALTNRLLELDKLKDEFLANTTHELKTPLQGIISITESLVHGAEGSLNPGQIQNLNLVAMSGRRLNNLIDDILDISKLKHGDIKLFKKSVHLQPLVEFIVTMFKQMHPHKPIEWKLAIPSGLPPVMADENRLVQILYNLIGNAVKFTDRGEIRITAVYPSESEKVEIHVIDTGVGIPVEQVDHIFQPFTQADASIARSYGGVGLGLTITKHLVELHNGDIRVVSTQGQGSCFTILLPVHDDGLSEVVVTEAYLDHLQPLEHSPIDIDESMLLYDTEQSGEHILVVDDDYASLQSSYNLLKLEGYTVTAVMNGRHALDIIQKNTSIRLVILDVMMPVMSGYEVCRTIRETKSPHELPVLMVTAKNQPEDLVLGFETGANDFIVKPYESLEFRARVRTLIELNVSMSKALKAEVAFLQAQIKPHFLFNTLNTISYLCTKDGAKASQLLDHLSLYLRNSFEFKSMDTLIQLSQELEFVNTYVEIEKVRFGERLQTKLDLKSNMLSVKIPPLILQPLVENAVQHGVMKKMAGGLVKVSVKQTGSNIEFCVTDNGVGISASRQEYLLIEGGDRGVGLRNVHQRLRSLYGTGLHIKSVEGQGTEIRFNIPI